MERRHASPSNSMLVQYNTHRQLAVAPRLTAAHRFGIPRGWGVEEVPRRDGSYIDRYYYEPKTGKKFRSIREVHRYLNHEGYIRRSPRNSASGHRRMLLTFKKNCKYRRMIVSGGKLFKLSNDLSQGHLAMVDTRKPALAAPDILPDGWIVEEVPRRYDRWIDKYYYEPETGQRFRSLVAVERHLAELEENENENAPLSKTLEEIKENKPLSKVFKLEYHTKKSTPRKKNTSQENTQASSFTEPPEEVNWVLASPQGGSWTPFISDSLITDAVKQQWANRFILVMNDGINGQS